MSLTIFDIPIIGEFAALGKIMYQSLDDPKPATKSEPPPSPPTSSEKSIVASPDEPRKRTVIEIRKEIIENFDGTKQISEKEIRRSEEHMMK